MKSAEVTRATIKRIRELLSYFDEIVLVTPKGSFDFYSMSPARGDDRLYIHGVKKTEEDRDG